MAIRDPDKFADEHLQAALRTDVRDRRGARKPMSIDKGSNLGRRQTLLGHCPARVTVVTNSPTHIESKEGVHPAASGAGDSPDMGGAANSIGTPCDTGLHNSADSDKLPTLQIAVQHSVSLAKHNTALEAMLADDQEAIMQKAPRMRAPGREVHATFFVAGDKSIGKTTFIHQLARSYKQGTTVCKDSYDGSSSSMQQFVAESEGMMCRLGPIKVSEERLSINMNLQDSPGVGDDITHKSFLRIMVRHILRQQAADYRLLGGNIKHLGPAMAGCLQNSVTAMLYFLPPHRVRKLDIVTMAALSELVPLIPVVGKADTMTQQEASTYREQLAQALRDPDGFVGKGNSKKPLQVKFFQFPDVDLLGVGVSPGPERHVYLLITSDTYQDGRPVRVYPYGVFDAVDRKHSDFIVLKRLLMGDKNNGFWSLQHSALDRYYSFCEQYEAANKDLDALVDNICAEWAPYLDTDGYDTMKQSLRDVDQSRKLKEVLSGLSKSIRLRADKGADQDLKGWSRVLGSSTRGCPMPNESKDTATC